MKRFFSLSLLLAVIASVGCNKPRVIPDEVLSDIFRDAMLINAYYNVKSDQSPDSLNIYEPVFARYGYTAEDVQYTVDNISRRKNARLGDVAERMISSLDERMQYLNRESAKLDTIENVAFRRYTRALLGDTTIVAKTAADSTKLRLYLYNIHPGYYRFTSLYSLDSLDKSAGRRYRIYFEREDSTRREFSEGSLMRRAETQINQNHLLIDSEDDIARLVIDFYHFDDDMEKKKRTVPKITIHDIRVDYTPPAEYCMKRMLDEQTQMRIFSDTLIHTIEALARKSE
ncbi:MAG: DUF4296 domain-containing protein [Alistipes sp.]|nr:DUF4296 domain-containing protein [Alistipes sp.]MBR3793373.1 DUF4296 domain-containing protein [Alistipes sp.]